MKWKTTSLSIAFIAGLSGCQKNHPTERALTDDVRAQTKTEQSFTERLAEKIFQTPAASDCVPTLPTDTQKVVFVSGFEGSGISTVAVNGLDNKTEVAQIVIEPGNDPLYIIAISKKSVIWNVQGHRDRVERFVTSTADRYESYSGVGVVGLPEDQVEFLPSGCMWPFFEVGSNEAILARGKIAQIIKRKPDAIAAAYTINYMTLPSGVNGLMSRGHITTQPHSARRLQAKRVEQGETLPQAPTLQQRRRDPFGLYLFSIEGVVDIKRRDVISPSKVQEYDVLPAEAGLNQLAAAGKIKRLKNGEIKILRPIRRFPAELTGSHSVDFILAKGMRLPKGSPGHSTVVSEATGECLAGRCR